MTQYPIELPPSSIAGLSPAQTQVIYKAPYSDHLQRLPKVGSPINRTLVNAVGLYFWGCNPIGAWSGTTQAIDDSGAMGSGGPALCPYGSSGENTIITTGKVYSDTGASGLTTTSVPLERAISQYSLTASPGSTWTYTIAWRKMVAAVLGWDGADITANVTADPEIVGAAYEVGTSGDVYPKIRISATHPGVNFDNYTFTGDDWVIIRRVNNITGLPASLGWYRVHYKDNTAGTTVLELTEDASIIYPEDTTVDFLIVQSAQAKYVEGCTWIDAISLVLTVGNVAVGDTLDIGGTTYTFVTDGTASTNVEINRGSSRANTINNIEAALLTDSRIEVLSKNAVNNANAEIRFRSADTTTYTVTFTPFGSNTAYLPYAGSTTSLTGSISRGRITKTASMDALVSTDDTIEFIASDDLGATLEAGTFSRADSRTADSIFVDNGDCGADGAANLSIIHWKRYPFVERVVDLASSTNSKIAWTGVLTGDGWASDTPRRGDQYIVWADTVDAGTTQVEGNNPESTPTFTSLTNTCASMWPYGQACRSVPVKHVAPFGYANEPLATKESQKNWGYDGLFVLPAETFVAGDKLKITTLSDFQTYGSPLIFEVLVLFDFDPEADWIKDATVSNLDRLVQNGLARGCAFQSPPFKTKYADHGVRVTIEGQAGSLQTAAGSEDADNYSQQWTCTFEVYRDPDDLNPEGGNGGPANRQHPTFPYTVGPIAHIGTSEILANASVNSRVAVLYKTEHPAMRHRVGYHGHYAGEPFSCTTGLGGTLLHQSQGYGAGQSKQNSDGESVAALPYAGSWRVASVNVEWIPGGSY